MNRKVKHIILLLSYVLVLGSVSFHHHTASELIPLNLLSETNNDASSQVVMYAGNCPVVQFAQTGFASLQVGQKFESYFANKINAFYFVQTESFNNSRRVTSLRAPPVA